MNELELAKLAQLFPGLFASSMPALWQGSRPSRGALSIAEGDLKASERMKEQPAAPLPEIPWLHDGKLFNLDGRQWSDGRAQSLDFYLQPSLSKKGIGIQGGGILYRKTY
jgi:hypothetical protein